MIDSHASNTTVNALVRAYHWNLCLGQGRYADIKKLAAEHGISGPSHC